MKWVMKEPKPGDMVRVGFGALYHFGIFVSDAEVIQFGLAPNSRAMIPDSEVQVLASDIDTFLAGGFLEVCEFDRKERKKHRKPEQVVAYARQRLGQRGYHILYNNCEHFANECLTGEAVCRQMDGVRAMFQRIPVVDVYLARMPGERPMPPLSCGLRQQDIDAVSAPELKRQKYYVWKLLEYALERSFGLKSRDLTFRREADRYCCDKARFSMSHCGDVLAVAVSREPVGIDLEKIVCRDTEPLASRVFSAGEMAHYRQLPAEEKTDFFFRLWTAKEALFKAAAKDVFIPAAEDALQGDVKSFAMPIGGEAFYVSVATRTPERIRFYENIAL